ncbi:hypothetical protein F503_00739 [Ophiostoma piceae UAMH 11346]|uniref:Uncharacterized protein n=1 Tax=Ophiostoma piceae (strain UAMH 11346) TaxID=1262450 RepID=S3C7N2_OPHP1|nr:hypothetical protein F503_00739 [Ophiostoma piceae UAMH 11346]
MRQGAVAELSYATKTPPRIDDKTHIIAVAHPDLNHADPVEDGWFLSDFYAFNILFKSLGASQKWLTAATPQYIVQRHGKLLHGNPFEDRKIVLDQDILDRNLITPVTVVAQKDMAAAFLKAVSEVSERAKRDGGSVLLMIFCHGLPGNIYQLGGQKGPTTSLTVIQGALENSVVHSMASVTTELATQVGTDDVRDDDNRLMNLDQETAQTLQTQTYNEFCHAVWRSCRGLHRLWREHDFTFSAQENEWGLPWNQESSVPLASYAERWEMLKTHPYGGSPQAKQNLDPSPQNPAFQASDLGDVQQGCITINPTPEETGTRSLSQEADSQISVEELDDPFLGPLITSLYRRRVEEMVRLWRQTCPGDENRSHWHSVNYFMDRCLETGQVVHIPSEKELSIMEEDPDEFSTPVYFEYNLADIIEYRLNMAQFAQHILAQLGLPRPRNQSCLAWYELGWADRMVADTTRGFADVFDVRKQQSRLFRYVHDPSFLQRLEPTPQQGPAFIRFHRYIIAGVLEARLTSEEEEKRVMGAILDMISEAEKFYERRVRADPEVQRLHKKYLGRLRR